MNNPVHCAINGSVEWLSFLFYKLCSKLITALTDRDYIIPKQIREHGLKKSNIKLSDSGILDIINSYTRESGVRELERKVGEIMRKVAKLVVSGEKKSVSVVRHAKLMPTGNASVMHKRKLLTWKRK